MAHLSCGQGSGRAVSCVSLIHALIVKNSHLHEESEVWVLALGRCAVALLDVVLLDVDALLAVSTRETTKRFSVDGPFLLLAVDEDDLRDNWQQRQSVHAKLASCPYKV